MRRKGPGLFDDLGKLQLIELIELIVFIEFVELDRNDSIADVATETMTIDQSTNQLNQPIYPINQTQGW